MSLSGAQKLGLIRELKQVRGSMDGAKGVNKLVLVKRLAEIRVLLSVKVEKVTDLELDLTDKKASLTALLDYAVSGIQNVPDALRKSESEILLKVFALVNNLPGDDISTESSVALYDALQDIDMGESDDTSFDYFSKNGRFFDNQSDYAKAILEHLEAVKNEPTADDSQEIIAKKQQIFEENHNLLVEVSALEADRDDHNYNDDAYNSLSEKITELMKKVSELDKLHYSLSMEKYNAKEARIAAIREQLEVPGQLVIDTLLSASSVTQEQADNWAKEQSIDKTSSAKLSKNGYKTADVRRDMAEFYRISGGKLRNIAIVSDGSKRANAGGIGQVEGMQISIDSNFNKETLWHEMAHHLEADPAAKQASNDFLVKRRESDTVYSLRSLTGNKGYGKDEGAYKDTFIHEYIGKVYRDQITEVWSMGVQYLSNPEQAAMFIAKDPEMASLIAGYLQAELTPAMKALKQVQGMTAGSNQTKRDDAEIQYQDAVKKLSAGVDIVDDGWFDDLDQYRRDSMLGSYELGDKKAIYLGSWGKYKVFSGKFRNPKTKRFSKGYSVSEASNDRIFDFSPMIEPLATVKAILKIAEAEGLSAYNVYMSNFIWTTDHRFFMNKAKQILEGNL
jgi:hypothetical protein